MGWLITTPSAELTYHDWHWWRYQKNVWGKSYDHHVFVSQQLPPSPEASIISFVSYTNVSLGSESHHYSTKHNKEMRTIYYMADTKDMEMEIKENDANIFIINIADTQTKMQSFLIFGWIYIFISYQSLFVFSFNRCKPCRRTAIPFSNRTTSVCECCFHETRR